MVKFKDLETHEFRNREHSALEDWYEKVRNIPVEEFSDSDLAKSLRQNTFTDIVLPFALRRIFLDIESGDKYEGELLASFLSVSLDIWKQNSLTSELYRYIDANKDIILEILPFDGLKIYSK